MDSKEKIVVVGGGFAGINLIKRIHPTTITAFRRYFIKSHHRASTPPASHFRSGAKCAK